VSTVKCSHRLPIDAKKRVSPVKPEEKVFRADGKTIEYPVDKGLWTRHNRV
jgi:hypothetical protein